MEIKKSVDIGKVYIKHSIMYVEHPIGSKISLEQAKKGVEKRLEISNGLTYPMFVDATVVVNFEKDARKYLSSKEAIRGISAGAFLVKNHIQKYLGQLWFKFSSKMDIPRKLFTDKEKALEWLSNYTPEKLN